MGTWLNNLLKKGGTEDWRKVLKEATGEDISTRAMMEYFKPLMTWLEEQTKAAKSAGNEVQASEFRSRRAVWFYVKRFRSAMRLRIALKVEHCGEAGA